MWYPSLTRRDSGAYLDPCLSSELTDRGTHKGKQYHMKGTGDFMKCQELVYPLLNSSVPCPRAPCSFNGIYQPKIDFHHSEFYGFSEYWYSMHDVLRIGGQYSAKNFKQAVTVRNIQNPSRLLGSFIAVMGRHVMLLFMAKEAIKCYRVSDLALKN